ncbi:MAG TPA: class I SAM-dependent methyltransferase [Vicinamibacterales bacterium]|nr:class I SAM-dependent methyltransferase [Vicinamibacterales bacterium]
MRLTRALGIAAASVAVLAGVLAYVTLGAFLPWRETAEAERLARIAGVGAGQTVAEIGAGTGRFSVVMARLVGPRGKVFSTELSADKLDAIRERAEAENLENLVVVEAGERETRLPDACCDLVFMRNVYHHVSDPEAFAVSVRRAVRSGGRLAVMDFEPGALWFLGGRPADTSEPRTGHGVSRAQALAEFTAAGFRLEREDSRWSGPMWLMLFSTAQPER